jgi:hypothetical protein
MFVQSINNHSKLQLRLQKLGIGADANVDATVDINASEGCEAVPSANSSANADQAGGGASGKSSSSVVGEVNMEEDDDEGDVTSESDNEMDSSDSNTVTTGAHNTNTGVNSNTQNISSHRSTQNINDSDQMDVEFDGNPASEGNVGGTNAQSESQDREPPAVLFEDRDQDIFLRVFEKWQVPADLPGSMTSDVSMGATMSNASSFQTSLSSRLLASHQSRLLPLPTGLVKQLAAQAVRELRGRKRSDRQNDDHSQTNNEAALSRNSEKLTGEEANAVDAAGDSDWVIISWAKGREQGHMLLTATFWVILEGCE